LFLSLTAGEIFANGHIKTLPVLMSGSEAGTNYRGLVARKGPHCFTYFCLSGIMIICRFTN